MKKRIDSKYFIMLFLLTVGFIVSPVFSMRESKNQHINEKVIINDLTIDYEIIGTGKPIIMVHGFGVDREVMRGCMEPIFANRPGWKRIYFDLPGMGKTSGAKWIKNSDDILDLTIRFIKTLCPEEDYLIVGESYGGYICRGIVYKEPENVSGMILICPLAVPDDSKRDVPETLIFNKDASIYESLSPYEKIMFDRMVSLHTKKVWDRFNKEMLSGWQKGDNEFLGKIRKIANYAFSFAVDMLPATFNKPSLIFVGRQDIGVGYKDMWNFLEQYPRASFVVLDMAGHALQIEQETVFNALVHELLDRVENKK